MWHVWHQGGPVELCTPARSDIPVPLGLPQIPNCSEAAGQNVADVLQLTAAVTDLHELHAACTALTG